MIVNNLNRSIRGVIALIAIASFTTACNDETNTANNSTTEDSATIRTTGDERSAPTTPEGTTTNTPAGAATAPKKKGKISTALKPDDETVKISVDKKGYYNRSEVLPIYPGGASSLDNYITENIEYPQDAVDNNAEGTVYVQFGVDEKGNISNVSTIGNKIGFGLEEEAVRVVSKMPKWTPGQVKGKTVKTWRTLPITYKIES